MANGMENKKALRPTRIRNMEKETTRLLSEIATLKKKITELIARSARIRCRGWNKHTALVEEKVKKAAQ